MTAPAVVKELVERFDAHKETYQSGQYNEAQLREEFLNPLFEAFGWDIYNRKGYADAYKEVIHEDAIKIGGRTKAPDYCFRVGGGQRSFFVEAKKPSVDIGEAISPAYQLRRYAWSAKLPVSILTDFEEFAVYDCRIRPDKDDKASTARVIYLNYTEYVERWDELYGLFSPEAIRKGSLERFVTSKKVKKGTAEVDKAFLSEIEGWRTELARHLALRNEGLEQRDLNFAVQRIIDRIIFLRICEDRGIEPYATLESLQNAPNIYRRMRELFQRADDRYNSGLFHFTEEKDRSEPPDELTLDLTVDDKPLKDILGGLYFPESPYEFSVFPVEILGQVYEQFLGKVIKLTKGHQAKVEDKPEVRKAGGVYYTPSYIVDYIVRHTVGKLLNGESDEPFSRDPKGSGIGSEGRAKMNPTQAAKLRILDPACGSGSFLLGAYQYLLDWHRDWYMADGEEKHAKGRTPKLYRGKAGDWRLTAAERKRILLNNIYGVDIDEQAVEVTKLSLLLKVLEGESGETVDNQIRLFHKRALPDLGDNIKCGNSLIGPDFYNGRQLKLFDDQEQLRVNVFDWQDKKQGFNKIMNSGGFDAVIGNPPYIRIQTLNEIQPYSVDYFGKHYVSAGKGNYDIYLLFLEKGLTLLNKLGLLGFICPHKFFNAKYGEALRGHLSSGNHLSHIVHFGHQQVFHGPTTYTCLLFLSKSGVQECEFFKVDDLDDWCEKKIAAPISIPAKAFTSKEWNIIDGKIAALCTKLDLIPTKLSNIAHLFVGLQTDADDVFILESINEKSNRILCYSESTGKEHWFESDHLKHFLKGSLNIRRYCLADATKRLIFPYKIVKGKSVLIDPKEYKRLYPLTWKYLEINHNRLAERNKKQMGRAWYGYVYKKNHSRFNMSKILAPAIAKGSCFAADYEGKYFFVGSGGGGGGGYGITLLQNVKLSDKYLLGLLNSNLCSVYLKSRSTIYRGGYIALNKQYIEYIPIRMIDFSNKADERRHDRMVHLVETMLELQRRLSTARPGQLQIVLQRQIAATDKQIDQLVYELYGLTDEEIAIVEQNT